MKDWVIANTDKLILLAIMVFFTCVLLHVLHDGGDMEAREWATGIISGAAGALYILITGKGKANDNGSKSSS